MASLTFEAFGKKFRTASAAAYILVRGPETWTSRYDGTVHNVAAHVVGYTLSGRMARKRIFRGGGPQIIKAFSLRTGQEVPIERLF